MRRVICLDACVPPLSGAEVSEVGAIGVDLRAVQNVPSLGQEASDAAIGIWAIEQARAGIEVIIVTRDEGFEKNFNRLDRSSMSASVHIVCLKGFGRMRRSGLVAAIIERLAQFGMSLTVPAAA